jgi:schlafen family protein
MDALIEVIRRGFESKDIDYKGPMAWDERGNKRGCCELVKDILALGNIGGGYLVIGVAERDDGFDWVGLTRAELATFDTTRVNQFLQNYADPPVNCKIVKVPVEENTYVVIEVPGFLDTPHICQKDYPGVLSTPALYVRTDNNESAQLKSSSDFRNLVEQAIRRRQDTLLQSFRAILKGTPSPETEAEVFDRFQRQLDNASQRFREIDPYREKGYTGYREMWCHPLQFETSRLNLEQMRSCAERASVNFRGWPFLFISNQRPDDTFAIQDGLETLVAFKDFSGHDRVDFWRFHQSLFFYQRTLMEEESYARSHGITPVMDVSALAMYAAEGIHCLTTLYEGVLLNRCANNVFEPSRAA